MKNSGNYAHVQRTVQKQDQYHSGYLWGNESRYEHGSMEDGVETHYQELKKLRQLQVDERVCHYVCESLRFCQSLM